LIEHPQRGNYDLDQLRADMHPQKPCREADAGRRLGACTYGV
jgi:hypothetical protein